VVREVSNPLNQGILARLWRLNGDIRHLPSENQELGFAAPPLFNPAFKPEAHPIAATFDHSDPWVKAMRHNHPGAAIFVARGERYWALPWFSGPGCLLGVWILDMAYWSGRIAPQIIVPRLAAARNVLRLFAPVFQQVRLGPRPPLVVLKAHPK